MNIQICFCVDQRMLPGLHVAARSLLESLASDKSPSFHVFSDDLTKDDYKYLTQTLETTSREFDLVCHTIDSRFFSGFPELGNSLATYFRLLIPEVLESGRVLYIDADTLCRVDVFSLFELDLEGSPIALAAEAPIQSGPDPHVADQLGETATGHYFNAGVMVLDIDVWRQQDLTRLCLNYITVHKPTYHDQSALNYVIHGEIHRLDDKFNCRTNVRRFWPSLRSPGQGNGTILHFVDFPKPWSRYGRWVHPFGKMWWSEFKKTSLGVEQLAVIDPIIPARSVRKSYRLMLKDRLLFGLYNSPFHYGVKGVG